jgi:dolichol-phosphate mannosyltransferase
MNPKCEDKMSLSVIMPALNEENNILSAIRSTLDSFKTFGFNGEIVIVNDGSTDRTGELIDGAMKDNGNIRLIEHETPQGIGASFWDGVDNARGDVVVMIPGDDENDSVEIFRYYKLLDHVDIVIPFVFNKEVRPLLRRIYSFIYQFIINLTFLVNFNYTNGTVLYRRKILEKLKYRSNGFFFQTDILIRLAKQSCLFAEVPYELRLRGHGKSKAISFNRLIQVIRDFLQLVKDCYLGGGSRDLVSFPQDSLTFIRRRKGLREKKGV